jgi:hypothetical protein
MSTLLSDLDSSPGTGGAASDGDLVSQIMREMNAGGGPPPPMPANPPPPAPMALAPPGPGLIMAPSSNTGVAQHTMEMNPATAHMINGSHPTPADFNAAMGGVPTSQYASAAPPPQPAPAPAYPRRSWRQRITEEVKVPVLVALTVFVFSLPVVNFLFAHYLPRMVLPTGQLTTIGLLLKAAAAGATFWLLQRVVVPLFSM